MIQSTTRPTVRRLGLAILLMLLLGGMGCSSSTPAKQPWTPTPAQQQLIDNWPTTTEGMLANLQASVKLVSTLSPDRIVVTQIAFKTDLPASEVIHWFENFPSSSFVTFYLRAGKIGGGFYNFHPETVANDGLVSIFIETHKKSLSSNKEALDQAKQRCQGGDPLCSVDLPRYQEAYDAEAARNETFVGAIALRSTARDIGLLQNDPRVFSINIESGDRPSGIPFYPEIKDVNKWVP